MKTFNKLIRDRIPEIIKKENKTPKIKILDELEYKQELLKKLIEESTEVKESFDSRDDLVKELGDLLEVIEYTVKAFNLNMGEINELKAKRKLERGGFDEKIFLESVE